MSCISITNKAGTAISANFLNQSKNKTMKTRNEFYQVENDHIAAEDRLRKEQDAAERMAADDRAYPAKVEPRSEAYRLCAGLKINPMQRFENKDTAECLAYFLINAKNGGLKGFWHAPSDQADAALKICEKIGMSKSSLLFGETMLHDETLLFGIIINK